MAKNYYFDMDGVLALYDWKMYLGDNPIYLRPGVHCFRNIQPDRHALELFDTLWRRARYDGGQVFTLTSLPLAGSIFNEHFHDKLLWLKEWIPYLPIENILISVTSKRDAAEFISSRRLSGCDILIDDFNRNLVDWQAAGGTAVKYGNGLNHLESFKGPGICYTQDVSSMIHVLNGLPPAA